jgi:hypothetical protein
MALLVLDDSPVLLLEPVRRALVVVVEERNERARACASTVFRASATPRFSLCRMRGISKPVRLISSTIAAERSVEASSTMMTSRGVHVCASALSTARRMVSSAS